MEKGANVRENVLLRRKKFSRAQIRHLTQLRIVYSIQRANRHAWMRNTRKRREHMLPSKLPPTEEELPHPASPTLMAECDSSKSMDMEGRSGVAVPEP